ncbi:hypothetical protein Dip510_000088 [Elusimicrobium posterum]|uniref:PHP domain-containing protein n=1 Tax=Elusimicrobium posterum TaxID=3116653 RepID=UPI003C74D944
MPLIDLHTHSKYSDGTSRPSEVVVDGAKRGVTLYALADHDTMLGVPEAREKCANYGIKFVSAVEVSTNEHEHLHFLGYKIDPEEKDFKEFLAINTQNRITRVKKIIQALNKAGVALTEEEVFAKVKTVASRAHIADALKKKGIVPTRQEGFRKYLVPGAPGYVPSMGVSVAEAITKIKNAGGLAVIAHPGLVRNTWDFKRWVDAGLDGIEVFYPSHNSDMRQELLAIAREYNLFVTAGSDHHGATSGRTPRVGMEIPHSYYDDLLKKLGF